MNEIEINVSDAETEAYIGAFSDVDRALKAWLDRRGLNQPTLAQQINRECKARGCEEAQ